MTELALLAQDVGTSERTLRRAVGQGTLRATRPTPRTLHVPLAERRYVRRAWHLLGVLRGALRTEKNVRLAVLFGSAATGTDTARSDVDVLVDLGDASLDRTLDLSAKLEAIVGRPFDLVRLEDARADPGFLADILAEGRVLVDRGRAWPTLLRREPSLRRRSREHDAQRIKSALADIDHLLAT